MPARNRHTTGNGQPQRAAETSPKDVALLAVRSGQTRTPGASTGATESGCGGTLLTSRGTDEMLSESSPARPRARGTWLFYGRKLRSELYARGSVSRATSWASC